MLAGAFWSGFASGVLSMLVLMVLVVIYEQQKPH